MRTKKESEALRYLGTSYVKIPRVVLNLVFSPENAKRSLGHLHLAMFTLSNFADRKELVNGKPADFLRGDLWMSQSELASYTGLHISVIKRNLGYLRERGLVTVDTVGNRSCMHLAGYDCFTAPAVHEAPVPATGRKLRTDLVNYNS